MMTVTRSYERSRCVSPELVLVDSDHGGLQIGRDGIKQRGPGELCELVHNDNNVGAWSLVDLLVAAHVKSIARSCRMGRWPSMFAHASSAFSRSTL
jgi:hypothetical protein